MKVLETAAVENNVDGFVLAGGESVRMGRNKALLELAGVPLILRTSRLVKAAISNKPAVIGPREPYEGMGLRVVEDDWPGAGPLGGIATALRIATVDWSVIVACDLPYLTEAWLGFIIGRARSSRADVVLPTNIKGAEPLCAMYHKRCEAAILSALRSGTRKVTDGLRSLRIESIEPAEWRAFDPEGLLFMNMNSPVDYEAAQRRFRSRSAG